MAHKQISQNGGAEIQIGHHKATFHGEHKVRTSVESKTSKQPVIDASICCVKNSPMESQ
jgi:hypothetical protein